MTIGTLYFTKEFTSGLLKGLRINEQITGDVDTIAKQFAIGTEVKVRRGSSYRIIDASFQNYVR